MIIILYSWVCNLTLIIYSWVYIDMIWVTIITQKESRGWS